MGSFARSQVQVSTHSVIVFLLVCLGIVLSCSPKTQAQGTTKNKSRAPSVYTRPTPPLGLPVSETLPLTQSAKEKPGHWP